MMQNSLPRLCEGIALTLNDVVLPSVTEPFARGQTLAAIELLRNLATRVSWNDTQARVSAQRLVDELALEHPDLNAVLSGLTDLIADELSRTRSGMFSKPTPDPPRP
jgi:hypothetical protein